jgi:ubiquinone/menaquinone biosynthesis C-methylase UbiE
LELPWLRQVIPFESFRGRRVLEIGCGAGYDAYDIARHGATYTGVDITPENIERTRRHLALSGLKGRVLEADAEALPFENEQFDVVFSNGVLHHVPDISAALLEANRVLKPDGDAWVIVYHRDSAFYWLTLRLWSWWLRGDRHRYPTFRDRLAKIEYTTADAVPIVNVYSRRQVRDMLSAAGFVAPRLAVRKLLHEDLPMGHRSPVKLLPQSVLDVFGRAFGWYVIARARKPG